VGNLELSPLALEVQPACQSHMVHVSNLIGQISCQIGDPETSIAKSPDRTCFNIWYGVVGRFMLGYCTDIQFEKYMGATAAIKALQN
jgi:hypothetical protein